MKSRRKAAGRLRVVFILVASLAVAAVVASAVFFSGPAPAALASNGATWIELAPVGGPSGPILLRQPVAAGYDPVGAT